MAGVLEETFDKSDTAVATSLQYRVYPDGRVRGDMRCRSDKGQKARIRFINFPMSRLLASHFGRSARCRYFSSHSPRQPLTCIVQRQKFRPPTYPPSVRTPPAPTHKGKAGPVTIGRTRSLPRSRLRQRRIG